MQKQNAFYWGGNKQKRIEDAKNNIECCKEKYAKEIATSINRTRIYRNSVVSQDVLNNRPLTVELFQGDSVSAVFHYATNSDKKVAVLNFASYKFPGGGYLNGSRAQEECLCAESFLYNVLAAYDNEYYDVNRNNLNKGLYTNAALYSDDVVFFRNNEEVKCDVLTCAAPNFTTANKYQGVSLHTNSSVMSTRIKFVLEIAKRKQVDTFIVGAWGCGVFGQDPEYVAKEFVDIAKEVFERQGIRLVFAVIPPLPNQTDNLTPFRKVVEEYQKRVN